MTTGPHAYECRFQMDWDNIRIFLSVARTGQFSAAALQLRIDNGTVGRRINALEKSLGVRLLDRQTTGTVLTAAGDRLYKTAEEVEAQLLRAQGDLSRSDVELSGTVRVAAPDGFTTLFLCSRLGSLKAKYPLLTVQLVPMSRTLSLSKREADLAITIERPDEGRLAVRKLIDYSLHFYAAKDISRCAPSASASGGSPRSLPYNVCSGSDFCRSTEFYAGTLWRKLQSARMFDSCWSTRSGPWRRRYWNFTRLCSSLR